MPYSVYILKHPETNRVVYVGYTTNPTLRLSAHRSKFFVKYGFVPVMEIVKVTYVYKTAINAEWKLIKQLRDTETLYQCTKRKHIGRTTDKFYKIKNAKAERGLQAWIKKNIGSSVL